MTIPSQSFSGPTVARSLPVRLFGSAAPVAEAAGPSRTGAATRFACPPPDGLAFQWAGDNSLGEAVRLGFQNQARLRGPPSPSLGLAAERRPPAELTYAS